MNERSLLDVAPEASASLLARSIAGDTAAFAEIMAEHDRDMGRVCMVICRDPELARDALQNAWQVAWRRASSVHDESRLRSWLLKVASNEARQLVRRERRHRLLGRLIGQEPLSPPPLAELLDLHQSLGRLSPAERELLALRYVIGLNATELAAMNRVPASTIRSRLARLLERLRKDLSHD